MKGLHAYTRSLTFQRLKERRVTPAHRKLTVGWASLSAKQAKGSRESAGQKGKQEALPFRPPLEAQDSLAPLGSLAEGRAG